MTCSVGPCLLLAVEWPGQNVAALPKPFVANREAHVELDNDSHLSFSSVSKSAVIRGNGKAQPGLRHSLVESFARLVCIVQRLCDPLVIGEHAFDLMQLRCAGIERGGQVSRD